MNAILEAFGSSSFRSCKRLPIASAWTALTPVTLPPGRARLATTPVATGSMAATNTTGIVLVAFFAGTTDGVPEATSTSNL